MTTLNEQERARLLRTLRENESFRTELRNLLLSQELQELPERFAEFATYVTGFVQRQEEFNERTEVTLKNLEDFTERQEEFNKRTEETLKNLEDFTERQEEFNKRTEETLKNLEDFTERQEEFNKRTDVTLGILKGSITRRLLFDHFESIIDAFNLEFVAVLSRNDLARMGRINQLHRTLAPGERQSFYRADMVMECEDDEGATCYVAVEASFTADSRDSDRAMRNARILTKMTGRTAHPMVASVVNDHAVQQLVDNGAIRWLQLDAKEMEAD